MLLAVFRLGRRVLAPDTTVGKNFADSNAARHLLDVGQVLGVFMVAAAAVKNCVRGEDLVQDIAGSKLRDMGLSLLFFMLAMAALWAFVTLFRALTTYDDAEQIHGENLAASLSYAGVSIAVAIIVGCALDGDFVSWETSLKGQRELRVRRRQGAVGSGREPLQRGAQAALAKQARRSTPSCSTIPSTPSRNRERTIRNS